MSLEHIYVRTLSSKNGITTEAPVVFSFVFWVRIVDSVEMVIPLKLLAEILSNVPVDGDWRFLQLLQPALQVNFIDSNKGVVEALQL